MMDRKIIFFDVDGTLYGRHPEGITPKVKDAIMETRKKGHLCFIATGRPDGFIHDDLKDIGFDGFLLSNGAHIKYHDQNLKVRYLDLKSLQTLISKFHELNIEYLLETPTLCYIRKEYNKLLDFFKLCHIDFKAFRYEFHEENIMKETIKLEAIIDNDDVFRLLEDNLNDFKYDYHPEFHTIEIYAKEVSKATAIIEVLDLLHMDVKDSYCFGDGPNDVEMFKTVGHSIAMGNAIEEVKRIADDITLSVQEDGVAYKLKELFG